MKKIAVALLLISSTLYPMDCIKNNPKKTNTNSTTKKSSTTKCACLKTPEFRRFLSVAAQTTGTIIRQYLNITK